MDPTPAAAVGEGSARGRWRLAVVVAWTLAALGAVALLPRLPQDAEYHAFADRRSLLLPNAADVLSNLGLLVAGLAGLAAARRGRFASPRERAPWLVFFASVVLIAPGSAWYHLAPTHATLLWDRLPMAAAFAALFVAALAERVGAGAARLLGPAAVASVGTVLYWAATEAAGAGDLRPYAFAQFYPMVAIPLVIALFPARATRGGGWVAGLALYGFSKLAEVGDALVFSATGAMSGHTLKHLLAAAAVATFARMVARRGPLGGAARGTPG